MYSVALIRIPLTEIFSRKGILNVKHGYHRAGNGQGKKFLRGQGKVREFHFKSVEILWTWIIILVMKLNNKLMVGFQKSRSFFHDIVKELHCINSCTLHVSGWKHKLISGCRGSGCEGRVEWITSYRDYFLQIVNSVSQGIFSVFRKNSEDWKDSRNPWL